MFRNGPEVAVRKPDHGAEVSRGNSRHGQPARPIGTSDPEGQSMVRGRKAEATCRTPERWGVASRIRDS